MYINYGNFQRAGLLPEIALLHNLLSRWYVHLKILLVGSSTVYSPHHFCEKTNDHTNDEWDS